jgi:uncharacterized protein
VGLSSHLSVGRVTSRKITETLDSDAAKERSRRAMSESGERNVLGGPLEPCGTDPMTGFYRDGCCTSRDDDRGQHTICAVVTREFLQHQRSVGNDLTTPVPQYGFPGLQPGDRWCVVAVRWAQAYVAGVAAPVVLASTNAKALDVVPLEALRQHAVDVPGDLSSLD